ncbi:hypothetical protein LTR53_009462 [Teratosphaeriaceae sp. CCFEE 6253]|nr:hypothetical protein LTR53_009462 [Teratosphaeriaceae sp. CCFEE 6253]
MSNSTTTSLSLSAFDLAMPTIYIRKLFGFRFTDPTRRQAACSGIQRALIATISRYPFAVARFALAEHRPDQQGPLVITYPSTVSLEDLRAPLFVLRELTDALCPHTYDSLCEQGAPPSQFLKPTWCSLPVNPRPGQVCPAFGLQVNFLEGGLVLCFSFHHAIFDGAAAATFLRAFGAEMAAKRSPSDTVAANTAALERLSWRASAPEKSCGAYHFAEYDFSSAPLPAPTPLASTARILTFTAAKLAALKVDILQFLHGTETPAERSVSTADCLGGLVWVAVLRARSARLTPESTARWAIAINARTRLDPPLPQTYMGNAVVHTLATAQIGQVVKRDEMQISLGSIACAATRVRTAVSAVDDTYLRARQALFSSLPTPSTIPTALQRRMDLPNTGLDFSDWREQGADVEFGIPGAESSEADWVRKTWSANEGAVNFMPRHGGGRGGDADWEVLLALSVADMGRVCEELMNGGWASRVVE